MYELVKAEHVIKELNGNNVIVFDELSLILRNKETGVAVTNTHSFYIILNEELHVQNIFSEVELEEVHNSMVCASLALYELLSYVNLIEYCSAPKDSYKGLSDVLKVETIELIDSLIEMNKRRLIDEYLDERQFEMIDEVLSL